MGTHSCRIDMHGERPLHQYIVVTYLFMPVTLRLQLPECIMSRSSTPELRRSASDTATKVSLV